MSGPDAGMVDKGKNTKVIRSKITAHKNNVPNNGVFLRVGGNMRNNGTILTGKDATVDIAVKGNYVSDKGKIVQGHSKSDQKSWYEKPIGIIILMIIGGVIIGGILYGLGWTGSLSSPT